ALAQPDRTDHALFLERLQRLQRAARRKRRLDLRRIVDEEEVDAVRLEEPQAVLDAPHRAVPGVVAAPLGMGAGLRGEHDPLAQAALQRQADAPLALVVEG